VKRSGPPKRKTALKQGTKGLKRAPLKRQSKPLRQAKAKVIDRIASEAWAKGARAKACAVCRARKGAIIRGHHIVYQQELRRIAVDLEIDLERLRWDDRNRLSLCDRCHERHHNGSRPVSGAVLHKHAPKVFQFAAEIDRQYGHAKVASFLERKYVRAGA
jgi:hypothetical protein